MDGRATPSVAVGGRLLPARLVSGWSAITIVWSPVVTAGSPSWMTVTVTVYVPSSA